MKTFNQLNEEWSQSDTENLKYGIGLVQKFIPTLTVDIQGMYGEVTIRGQKVFDTHGSQCATTVATYIAGMLQGLMYK